MKVWDMGRFMVKEELQCFKCGDNARAESYDRYKHRLTSYCNKCDGHWTWDYSQMKWVEMARDNTDEPKSEIEISDDDLPF